jgi:hypothetical protein
MIKIIKKQFKVLKAWVQKYNFFNFVILIFKIIVMFSFIFLIVINYISYYIVLQSVVVMFAIIAYKFILNFFCKYTYLENLNLKQKNKFFIFLHKYIVFKNGYIIQIIYYMLYYFPTN